GDPAAVLDDALDRLDVVELAHHAHRHAARGEHLIGGAAGGDVPVESDPGFTPKPFPGDRIQGRERVIRGHDADHRLAGERDDVDVPAGLRVGDDAEVDAAGAQHLNDAVGAGVFQVDVHLRIPGDEAREV